MTYHKIFYSIVNLVNINKQGIKEFIFNNKTSQTKIPQSNLNMLHVN
jgi:hypothetical protein